MTLTWNEYQQQALTTAIYPLKRELEYTAFGLLSEVGELAEAMGIETETVRLPSCRGELGDTFWYVAAMGDALNVPLQHIYDYLTAFSFRGDLEAEEVLPLIMVQAGLVAGYIKKSIRDNDGFLSDRSRVQIITALCKLMAYSEYLADEFGSSVNGILNDNLNKLADRKQRGVLKGSGDSR